MSAAAVHSQKLTPKKRRAKKDWRGWIFVGPFMFFFALVSLRHCCTRSTFPYSNQTWFGVYLRARSSLALTTT